jgi:hypothetical protein
VQKLTNRLYAITENVQKALTNDLGTRARQLTAAASLKDRIVRRAASVREQLSIETTPIQFGPSNEVLLEKWTSSSDYGQASFRRQATPETTLEIILPGRRTYASWRTEAYLAEGEYQLVGRLKLINPVYEPGLAGQGATIRLSGKREAPMIREAPDWRTITYDLEVLGQEDLILVCEFRGVSGTAVFDASSLKLVRKSKPTSPR